MLHVEAYRDAYVERQNLGEDDSDSGNRLNGLIELEWCSDSIVWKIAVVRQRVQATSNNSQRSSWVKNTLLAYPGQGPR
jgi:hypothetical protein